MTELPLVGQRPAISDVAQEELAAWLVARGEPVYRASQVLGGVHRPAAGAGRIGDEGDPGEVPHLPFRSSAIEGLRAAMAAASNAARVAVGARRQPASCSAAHCFDRTWGSASVPST